MVKKTPLYILLMATALLPDCTQAQVFNFNETFFASGYLDGNAFGNSLVTLKGTGDSTNVTPFSQDPSTLVLTLNAPVSVSVGLLNSQNDTFSIPIVVFRNDISQVGFGDMGGSVIGAFGSPLFANYDLNTPIAALGASPTATFGSSFATNNQGYNPGFPQGLEIDAISGPATFTATPVGGGGTMGAVPELSTWAMFLLGFGGAGLLAYVKKRDGGSVAPVTAV